MAREVIGSILPETSRLPRTAPTRPLYATATLQLWSLSGRRGRHNCKVADQASRAREDGWVGRAIRLSYPVRVTRNCRRRKLQHPADRPSSMVVEQSTLCRVSLSFFRPCILFSLLQGGRKRRSILSAGDPVFAIDHEEWNALDAILSRQ